MQAPYEFRHEVIFMSNDTISEAERKANQDGSVDKAKGHANETIGKIKEKVGSVIGDHELEAKGQVQNAEGKGQRVKGEIKEKIDDAIDTVKGGVEAVKDKINEVRNKH